MGETVDSWKGSQPLDQTCDLFRAFGSAWWPRTSRQSPGGPCEHSAGMSQSTGRVELACSWEKVPGMYAKILSVA